MKYFTYGELTQRIGTMIFCEKMEQRYRNYIDMKYKYNDDWLIIVWRPQYRE